MDLLDAAEFGDINKIMDLLESGADPNFQEDDMGETALMIASREKWLSIVKLLLDSGANPNLKDNEGNTALMYTAVYNSNIHLKIIRLLLNSGANPLIKNNDGEIAYDLALSFGYIENAKLIKKYMDIYRIYHIQALRRGNLTRRKLRTSRAMQRLHASRLPIADDLIEMISKRLSHMPIGPMDIQRGSGFSKVKYGRKGKRTKKRLYRYY